MTTMEDIRNRMYRCDQCGRAFRAHQLTRENKADQFGNKYVLLWCGECNR